MNALEQRLRYPLGEQLPERGHALDVAPGVRWVRMGLPFALDHINLWLLRDEIDGQAGWTIVDCGIANDATREAWAQVFEQELHGLPVLRVIVTHMHPDHVGLADWLTARWQCRMWISATDYNVARMASQSTTGHGGEAAAAFFASHGLTDPDALDKVRKRSSYYASMVPSLPASYRRLQDGQRLQIGRNEWRCIVGFGHAPEHMSLYDEASGVLISGDMLLPRISTNVSVFDLEPEGNPLALYLASIRQFLQLSDEALVLPSHGRPFRGMHERVRQLLEHHDSRLAEVLDACGKGPCSGADILPVMFRRPLDLHQTTFAIGEAIAHLHALWFEGKLRRELCADGIYRFSTVKAA